MPDWKFYIALIISAFIILSYAYQVLKVSLTWKRIPEFSISATGLSGNAAPQTSISIIIPSRNEADNIGNCLLQVSRQNYPADLFEIIQVDDHSNDQTVSIARKFFSENKQIRTRIFSLTSETGKKSALKMGIANSGSTLIVTLDADCSMGERWLSSLAAFYEQQGPKMIVGPIDLKDIRGRLGLFQQQELLCLSAFAGAWCGNNKPILCNGANLAFVRTAFADVKGYEGNENLASGDDVFLLNKFRETYPSGVKFLKSRQAIVYTRPQNTFGALLQQRRRWASKAIANKNPDSFRVGLLAAGTNILLFLYLFLSIFYGRFAVLLATIFTVKFLADCHLLKAVSCFFDKRMRWVQVLLSAAIYPIYGVVVLMLSMRGKYEWKGRRIR